MRRRRPPGDGGEGERGGVAIRVRGVDGSESDAIGVSRGECRGDQGLRRRVAPDEGDEGEGGREEDAAHAGGGDEDDAT
eukprot:3923755-Pyramimonas_sp.AAC.1